MALFDPQHPWAFAFGLLGNIVSFMVFLAPVPTFYRIYKKKSTEGFRSLPYLVALFSCMMWLYYAMLKKDIVLIFTINSFGCVVETIYISMFIAYAAKEARNSTIRLFLAMNVAFFSMIILFCYFALKGSKRVEVLGWINVAIAVSVFAAPLSIIAQVIRTKSVEFMPFNLSFFLTLSAVMWFAYGMLKHDKCVAIPNVLGFLFGVVQMVLYAMYMNKDNKVVEEKKMPENIEGAVVLCTLGNRDLGHADDASKPQDIIIDIVKQDAKKNQEKTKQVHEISKEASDGSEPNDETV